MWSTENVCVSCLHNSNKSALLPGCLSCIFTSMLLTLYDLVFYGRYTIVHFFVRCLCLKSTTLMQMKRPIKTFSYALCHVVAECEENLTLLSIVKQTKGEWRGDALPGKAEFIQCY